MKPTLICILLFAAGCSGDDPYIGMGSIRGPESWGTFSQRLDPETARLITKHKKEWDLTVRLETWCDYLPRYDKDDVQQRIDEMEAWLKKEALSKREVSAEDRLIIDRLQRSLSTAHAEAIRIDEARNRCEVVLAENR